MRQSSAVVANVGGHDSLWKNQTTRGEVISAADTENIGAQTAFCGKPSATVQPYEITVRFSRMNEGTCDYKTTV